MLVVSRNLLKLFGLRSLSLCVCGSFVVCTLDPCAGLLRVISCRIYLGSLGRRIFLDMLVLQKLELYGLAGATHLDALCLDNYHSLCFTLSSSLICFGFSQFSDLNYLFLEGGPILPRCGGSFRG